MSALMDLFFSWIEHTAFSIWIRESLSIFAFPGILTLHTAGLAVLAGTCAAFDLRILGVAPRLPLGPMARFFPLTWLSFWVTAATGIALVIAYPAKAFTNPLFYVKLLLVGAALWTLMKIRREVFIDAASSRRARLLAGASLFLWAAAIVSGRLLAYTYTRLLTELDL